MSLLVSTSFSLLELDAANRKVRRIHQGKGLYYGIAVAHEQKRVYVAARKRMVSSLVPQEEERGEIIVFNFDLKEIDRVMAPFPLRDMHQIAWHGKKLWVTCSYDNLIAIWDGDAWEVWYPLGKRVDGEGDVHHYNSLMFEDNLVWILAHNRGPSELLGFAEHDRALVQRVSLGNQAHNIWRENAELFTCSSGEGRVLGYEGSSIATEQFPRGYALYKNERFVGISEIAERGQRDFSDGRILIFDRAWRRVGNVTLHAEGLVLDIVPFDNSGPRRDGFLSRLLGKEGSRNK